MSNLEDVGVTLRGSHLREIRAEINAAIAASEENHDRARKKEVAHERAYRTLILILGLVLSVFPIWLVLEQFNFVDIIPEPNVASTAPTATISDLVGVIIPLLTVVIAFFLGSTGLKRLQIYDSELSQNRSERRSETEKLRAEISRELERGEARAIDASVLRAERIASEARIKLLEDANKMSAEQADTNKEARDGIRERYQEYLASLNGIVREIEIKAQTYDWIFSDSNMAVELKDDSIGSVGELHNVITRLFRSGKSPMAKALVEKHFDHDVDTTPRIFGSADDFFNTAIQFAKEELETLAYRICEGGLKFHPRNADLVSSCMKYALSAGK